MKYVSVWLILMACRPDTYQPPEPLANVLQRARSSGAFSGAESHLVLEYRYPKIRLSLWTDGKYDLRYRYQHYSGVAMASHSRALWDTVLNSDVFVTHAAPPSAPHIVTLDDEEYDVSLWTRLDDGSVPFAFQAFIDEVTKNAYEPLPDDAAR